MPQPSERPAWTAPLTYAVFSGNCPVVEWHLTRGADPDCRYIYPNPGGYEPYPSLSSWPVLYAATWKDASMLRCLLEHGASVHVARRPLMDRWGFGGPEVYDRVPNVLTPLHLAAYHRRYHGIRLLVFYGADFRRKCDLEEPGCRGRYMVEFNASGTARDAVITGLTIEHAVKSTATTEWQDDHLHENAFTYALEEYGGMQSFLSQVSILRDSFWPAGKPDEAFEDAHGDGCQRDTRQDTGDSRMVRI
ncbi:hypothetical protein KFL_000350230 [Klebsormidium nitens]|uniref:Uncharacterized protein n=1 Tax=Klebsormidium nitens TaxID=105231 RepID=A0A1Y1HR64_KLENI|nr:hypothetical protein KFL_000350230 [Klebsormidium nitens]|eukprot:GAQ79669.1 hypothetical protein KFL_000350230 [Klebsormidium nitens]